MPDKSDISRKVEKMGLRTISGEAKEGFFIPYRYAGDVSATVDEYVALAPIFQQGEGGYSTWLEKADAFYDEMMTFDGGDRTGARFNQYWCPRLDASILYTMVRSLMPERIVEIGAGHSTRFIARAISDGDGSCDVTAVDPAPRKEVDALGVSFIPETLQSAGTNIFGALKEGDFLCVDSSHILMPGSDVDIIINRVLPTLPAGAIVYFHDIFLPRPYPQDWHWRGYNEQNAVGGLLQGGYEVLFASHYVVSEMTERFAQSKVSQLAILPGAHECGLWLRKR